MLFPKIITAIIFFAGLTLLGTVVWQVGLKSVLVATLLSILAGSAINQVTPTAMVGGELVHVILLAQALPRASSGLIVKTSVRFAVLSTLGIAQLYGLARGLITRMEQLVRSGSGLLAYALCTRFP